jgi:hypothetical protein
MSVPGAQTEPPPVLGVHPPAAAPLHARRRQARAPIAPLLSAGQGLWWITLVIAAIFCFITFHAKGGLNLESMTSTEMALTLGAGVVVAARPSWRACVWALVGWVATRVYRCNGRVDRVVGAA